MAGTDGGTPRRRISGTVGVAATALVVAVFTAIGTGLGSKALHAFDGGEEVALVSSSAREEISECGTPLFVAGGRVEAILAQAPQQQPWLEFQRANGAHVADRSVVTVSIQGESSRTVTLTGIRFDVERRPRPAGASFALPCGGGVGGRSVYADLDRRPVAIVRSNADPRASLDEASQRPPKPIRFPWTVSVTDPLLLTIVATTKRCACTWRATIGWVSGGESGQLQVDDGGRGYTVVGVRGARSYVAGGPGNRWSRLE